MNERLAMIRQMGAKEQADTRLENAIAYARELEGIIASAEMNDSTRMLVDYLVGKAKEKFNMYNND